VEEKLVLDTSVVLKWYLQHETYAEQALLLRQAYLDGRSNMIAPDLLLVEFANILRYQLEMTTDEIKDTVQGLLDMGFEWVKLAKLDSSLRMKKLRVMFKALISSFSWVISETCQPLC